MSINGLNGVTPAVAPASTEEAAPAATTSGTHKSLYGDPSRGEGLMNTMAIMKGLVTTAKALVGSRNNSLQ